MTFYSGWPALIGFEALKSQNVVDKAVGLCVNGLLGLHKLGTYCMCTWAGNALISRHNFNDIHRFVKHLYVGAY